MLVYQRVLSHITKGHFGTLPIHKPHPPTFAWYVSGPTVTTRGKPALTAGRSWTSVPWGYPDSWMVYFISNPKQKWMGCTPILGNIHMDFDISRLSGVDVRYCLISLYDFLEQTGKPVWDHWLLLPAGNDTWLVAKSTINNYKWSFKWEQINLNVPCYRWFMVVISPLFLSIKTGHLRQGAVAHVNGVVDDISRRPSTVFTWNHGWWDNMGGLWGELLSKWGICDMYIYIIYIII